MVTNNYRLVIILGKNKRLQIGYKSVTKMRQKLHNNNTPAGGGEGYALRA